MVPVVVLVKVVVVFVVGDTVAVHMMWGLAICPLLRSNMVFGHQVQKKKNIPGGRTSTG